MTGHALTSTPTILEAKDILGDEEDSLVNRLPEVFREDIHRAVTTRPEYFGVDDRELLAILRKDGITIGATDHRLRMNFWLEHDKTATGIRKMSAAGIFHGVCTRHYLMDKYMKIPGKVAWLLCPPASYAIKVAEALEFGIEQLRDILAIPHVGADGKFNSRMAETKVKIVALLDLRVKGAVVQRNLNVNVNERDITNIKNMAQESTMESLQEQLRQLEYKERVAKNVPLAKGDIEGECRSIGTGGEIPPSESDSA